MFMQEMALQNFFPSQVVSNIMVIAQVTYLCFYWFPQMAFFAGLPVILCFFRGKAQFFF